MNTKNILSYTNNSLGLMSTITNDDYNYHVTFKDIDSNEVLPTIILYPKTEEGFFKAHLRAFDFIKE